jgi:dihydrofolate reductase
VTTAAVYIATSLDGFIARENGDLDWLHAADSDLGAEDYGYAAFMSTVDAIVMGRHTYEKVRTFAKWPYTQPVFVLSTRRLVIASELRGFVEVLSGEPGTILTALSARGIRGIYVDGGKTIQRFLEAGSISRLIITRLPILIGQGIPLFGPLSRDIRLQHLATRQYPNGFVQSEYSVLPA